MNKKGFTLIEVLVAATIIAILASVAIASYSTAAKNSRDAKRKSDFANLAAALELYRSDNGLYINISGNQDIAAVLGALITGGYISQLPTDPKPTTSPSNTYLVSDVNTTGTKFCLMAVMENTVNANGDPDNSPQNPCNYNTGLTNYNYFVANP